MLRNYIITSWRSLKRDWELSIVNVTGLSLGMAVCFILFAWVNFELSYDKQHAHADLIYRANISAQFGGQPVRAAVAADGVYDYLLKFEGVNSVCRVQKMTRNGPVIVKNAAGELLEEQGVYYADSMFFKMFDFPFVAGDVEKVLKDNTSIVITESAAQKYFREENPLGKDIIIQDKAYRVDGIIKDLPVNSSFKFNLICSIYPIIGNDATLANNANHACYVQFKNQEVIPEIISKINEDAEKEVKETLKGADDYWRYEFIALKDIHLYSTYEFEMEPVSNILTVKIFSLVALLVLLMAIINYVNLTSAKAMNRAKEIGVRKVVGALRPQLVTQFITESLMVSMVSFAIALFLSFIFIPIFNALSGQHLVGGQLLETQFLALIVAIAIGVGIISGVYPAFVITSYKLTTIVKGKLGTSNRGSLAKKVFVTIQFAIGVALIFSSVVIFQQFNFIQSKSLGYNKNNVIAIPLDKASRKVIESLKTELNRVTSITSSGTGNTPASIKSGNAIAIKGKLENKILVRGTFVDEGYLPTLGIQVMAGRNFQKNDLVKQDSNNFQLNADNRMNIIINESTLNKLNLTVDDAFEKVLVFGNYDCQVVGILKDFHFASLRQPIEPMVLNFQPQISNTLLLGFEPGNVQGSIEKVEEVYQSIIHHRPLSFTFLDDEIENQYKGEKQLSSTIFVFTILSVIVIGLGMSSLIAYTITQRMKEINVRKVLGVSFLQIIRLMVNEFMPVILVGIMISLPVTFYVMNNWLDNFAYRISINWIPFAVSFILGVAVYVAVVTIYSRKAFVSNVAEVLRGD